MKNAAYERIDKWILEMTLNEKIIDRSVARILEMLVKTGLADGEDAGEGGCVNTPSHQALARELAEESVILLKNDADILLLDLNKIKKIAIIGPNADDVQIGDGDSSDVIARIKKRYWIPSGKSLTAWLK